MLRMTDEKPKKRFGNVFYVGLLSFFGGVSQDMFVPILPLYLANVLGFSKEFIGLSEGLLTAASSVFRFIAPTFPIDSKAEADRFCGILSFHGQPSAPGIFLRRRRHPRFAFYGRRRQGRERFPKEVLIAGSTEPKRGRGFGIARMLDTFGSARAPFCYSFSCIFSATIF